MLVAGDVSAEIVTLPIGAIQLVAYGPQGALTGDADIKVSVPDTSGASHDVNLVWNADASAYLGSVEEGLELGNGPLGFTVVRSGVEQSTRVAVSPVRAPSHEGDVVVALVGGHQLRGDDRADAEEGAVGQRRENAGEHQKLVVRCQRAGGVAHHEDRHEDDEQKEKDKDRIRKFIAGSLDETEKAFRVILCIRCVAHYVCPETWNYSVRTRT